MELNKLFIEQNINLKDAFDTISEGLVVINPQRDILYYNRAAALITGRTQSGLQLEGPGFYGVYHADEETLYSMNELPSMRALSGKEVLSEQLFIKNENIPQGRYVICTARPLFHQASVTGAVMTFRDVTEQVRSERRRIEEKIKMETSARLACMGQLMAEIAHEINNPLASINSSCWLIKRLHENNNLSPELIEQNIGNIEALVLRMQEIVRSLRNLSHQSEPMVATEYLFQDVWQDVKSVILPKISPNKIQLQVIGNEKLFGAKLVGIHNELAQVLINLLINAIDAVENQTEGMIIMELEEKDNYLICRIRDNGPGVAPEIKHKLFTLFFTTKPIGKGTGLGLSLSRTLAIKMGGSLHLNDKLGPSCFELKVPLVFN